MYTVAKLIAENIYFVTNFNFMKQSVLEPELQAFIAIGGHLGVLVIPPFGNV